MKPIITELSYIKSTKNKHVYGNDKINAPITGLYIERDVLPTDYPKTIKVVITEGDLLP